MNCKAKLKSKVILCSVKGEGRYLNATLPPSVWYGLKIRIFGQSQKNTSEYSGISPALILVINLGICQKL